MDEIGIAFDGVADGVGDPSITETHTPELLLSRRRLIRRSGGVGLVLIARVSCLNFCDLRGTKVLMRSSSGEEWEEEIVAFNGAENETREIIVAAGPEAGAYTWTATYSNVGDEGRPAHCEVESAVSFEYRPHAVSLATWGIPLPSLAGQAAAVRVGAKCADGCCLAGARFRIYDDARREVAVGALGEAPREGTDGLYWAQVPFVAPDELGVHRCTVRLAASGDHSEAQASFTLLVVEEPPHRIKVAVTNADTGGPIASAKVSLHPFVETTDSDGCAVLPAGVSKGNLRVVAEDYEEERLSLMAAGDMDLHVALKRKPEDVGDF